MSTMKRLIITLVALSTLLVGCGYSVDKATEKFKDAPRGGMNDGPADIITMPDGFSNVSSKCDGPNRVYVIFHGDSTYGSVAVAPNDPRCGE